MDIKLNEHLEAKCIKRTRLRFHPEITDKTKWDVYLEENKSLTVIHREFDAYVDGQGRVGMTQLVQIDRNKYNVPAEAINKNVNVRIYAHKGVDNVNCASELAIEDGLVSKDVVLNIL